MLCILREMGETLGKMHYHFATEIVLASLVVGTTEIQEQEILEGILARTAKLIAAVRAIDDVFACYARLRRLPSTT